MNIIVNVRAVCELNSLNIGNINKYSILQNFSIYDSLLRIVDLNCNMG